MMLFPLVLGFSSCDKAKELEPNPLAKQLSGLWWSLTDISGTLPEDFGGADYTRIGQAFQLNEDGTGYSVTFFFNDENSNPIYVVGGKSMAKLTYTDVFAVDGFEVVTHRDDVIAGFAPLLAQF